MLFFPYLLAFFSRGFIYTLTQQLKQFIQEKLVSSKMNTSELERKAGLSATSIRKILLGSSQNPTLETLNAIANVFNCSLDELVGRRIIDNDKNLKKLSLKENLPLSTDLLSATLENSISLYKKKEKEITLNEFINFVLETYQYCMLQKNGMFDKEFHDWYFEQTFNAHK